MSRPALSDWELAEREAQREACARLMGLRLPREALADRLASMGARPDGGTIDGWIKTELRRQRRRGAA
ncbi:MAG: hypothetical protein E7001_02995 [Coriobacteriaceae bacterium]|nr:hypothetical protein [Coriobacteriaceae bacterium]